jgi:hypothetical protein
MDHVQLHDQMSQILKDLVDGKAKPQFAREYFNGAGKLIANCKNELIAINMGAKIEVPLLNLSANDAGQLIPLGDNSKKHLGV